MAKKILFLSRDVSGVGYENAEQYAKVLPEYFGQDYSVYGCFFEDLIIDSSSNQVTIIDQKNKLNLADYDFVFMFGWFVDWKNQALAVAAYLNHHNIKFINDEALKQRSSSKISQAVLFGLNNIPIPRTINVAQNDEVIQQEIIEKLGLPFIFKIANGSKGVNNFLINSAQEFQEILKRPDINIKNYIAQEYIESDRDYRVLCAYNKIYMVIERKGQDDSHINNTSQGAKATELPVDHLSDHLQEVCIRAANVLNRQFSGVDLIQKAGTDQYYVLEANNMPQMLSGTLPDRKAEVLASLIKDQLEQK